MKLFQNQTFERFYDQDSAALFSGVEFLKCKFVSCAISITLNPKLRSTVRGIKIVKCEALACSIKSAIIEDVTIDDFKTPRLFQAWGAVFKYVILKGKIGRVMFSPIVFPGKATKEQQQAFDDANATYYKTVDWAMDISQGEFTECDLRGVPGHLIRRDPETQVLVTRVKALQGEWRNLDLSKTYWGVSLDLFLAGNNEAVVLVAPKRSKKFPDLLAGLKLLRDAGVAEPN
jgi:hypothetical protein